MSSFGVSGTNAHVVIEQAPDLVAVDAAAGSGGDDVGGVGEERRSGSRRRPGRWPTGWPAPVPVWGWPMWPTRSTTTAPATPSSPPCAPATAPRRSPDWRALAAGQAAVGVVGAHEGPCRPGTVFVYSGQGSQWAGMGRQLLADEPAFAAAIAELEPVFVEQVGFSLQQVLAEGETVSGMRGCSRC